MHKSLVDFKVTWKILIRLRLNYCFQRKCTQPDNRSVCFCCYSSGRKFFQPQ